MPLTRKQIAWRAAQDLYDGIYVNLGIGMPTLVADVLPEGREIVLQSENGVLGVGPAPGANEIDLDLVNAGKQPVTLLTGGSYVHHTDSFLMIRGGRSVRGGGEWRSRQLDDRRPDLPARCRRGDGFGGRRQGNPRHARAHHA